MPQQKIAVSVVIPLYNAEKYIGACLESLLAQTFTDFEVIVIDDCSADNSVAVVKSYASKFDGRLKLARTKKNSGGAGLPRNRGIELSRGEYVYFLDPDDAVTPTALAELYTHAKNFDADVVQCEKWYPVPDELWDDAAYRKSIKPTAWPAGEKIFIKEPTLLTTDFAQRVVDFGKRWLTWSVCLQMVRRDFIFDNALRFENIYFEDFVFTACALSSAQKYLVVPNVIYFYRQHAGSTISTLLTQADVPKLIGKQVKALIGGVKYLDEFLGKRKPFAVRPDLKYLLFDMFTQEILGHLSQTYAKVPASTLDKFLRKEFTGDNAALTAFLFGALNVQRLQLIRAQRQLAQRPT